MNQCTASCADIGECIFGCEIGGINNASTCVTSCTGLGTPCLNSCLMVVNQISSCTYVSMSYAVNLGGGDSFINITNNGALSTVTTQSGTTAAVPGAVCANVYAFDPGEELLSCCSCPVTPDGLVSLSAQKDLLANALYNVTPSSISITLVATAPVTNSCVNAASTVGTASLVGGLSAWSTTLHSNTSASTLSATEVPFQQATISQAELARLAQVCAFAQQQGSNFGICNSCPGSGQ